MRRQTKPGRLARRGPTREPYAKVLIVCEGEKTEPGYFQGLKDALRLNSANIEIVGKGKTPSAIVEFARKRYLQEKTTGDAFDKVFCVFDKNQHADYNEAMETIRQLKPRGQYEAIPSIPAFEYWLLLHHTYSTSPCTSSQALRNLKHYMPDYRKGDRSIFDKLKGKLDDAKQNAMRSLEAAEKSGADDPSTRVHELVAFLQELKR